MIRFIHLADLHIDRAFEGMDTTPEMQAELRLAPQRTLDKIVDMAREYDVDFLLIAGDTFHQSISSPQTQATLLRFFERLKELRVEVAMIFGNHDYYRAERFWFRFPENVHLFTSETATTFDFISKSTETVKISGASFNSAHTSENLAADFPMRDEHVDYHFALYHGEMGGVHSRYAPFTLGTMLEKQLDYWALGHIHQSQILDTEGRIRYAGTALPHSRKEKNTGEITLVEMTRTHFEAKSIEVSPVAFVEVVIDAKGIATNEELNSLLLENLEGKISDERQLFLDVKIENLVSYLTETIDEEEFRSYFNQLNPTHLNLARLLLPHSTAGIARIPLDYSEAEIAEKITAIDLTELLAPLLKKRGVSELLSDEDYEAMLERAKLEFLHEFIPTRSGGKE